MTNTLKKRTAAVLHATGDKSRFTRFVDIALMILITLNVVAVVLESVPEIREPLFGLFLAFEILSVGIFTIEYILRVWSVTEGDWQQTYRHPVWGRLRYMCSPLALIDLLAILPFYLALFFSVDLRFLRVLRLLRILKLTRYSTATTMLFDVFREEARVIGASLFVLVLLMVVASSLIYLAEHAVQPEDFGTIPRSMWWAIITMTTVGYGDAVPITGTGKLIGGLMGVIGIGMVALPAGILASGFNRAMHARHETLEDEVSRVLEDGVISAPELDMLDQKRKQLAMTDEELREIISHITRTAGIRLNQQNRCPHCGKPLGG